MTTPRVSLLDPEHELAAAEEVGVPGALADRSVFRVLLHRAMSDRLRELVSMRIGWATVADAEWTQHWTIAQAAFGCGEADLLELRDGKASPPDGRVGGEP